MDPGQDTPPPAARSNHRTTEQSPEPEGTFQPAFATNHQTAPPPEAAWHGSEAQILSNLELQTAWMPLGSPPAHTEPQAGLWQYLKDLT